GGGARVMRARADAHLVVFHPARAPGVAIEEHRVAVGITELREQALQGRVVGIVERPQSLLEVGERERTRKDGRIAHGVGAHHPTSGAHLAVLVLEVVAAAIDVHEDARERCREDGGRPTVPPRDAPGNAGTPPPRPRSWRKWPTTSTTTSGSTAGRSRPSAFSPTASVPRPPSRRWSPSWMARWWATRSSARATTPT